MKLTHLHIPFSCLPYSPSSIACALSDPLTSAMITQTADYNKKNPPLFTSSWSCFDALYFDQTPENKMDNKPFLDRYYRNIVAFQYSRCFGTIYLPLYTIKLITLFGE